MDASKGELPDVLRYIVKALKWQSASDESGNGFPLKVQEAGTNSLGFLVSGSRLAFSIKNAGLGDSNKTFC